MNMISEYKDKYNENKVWVIKRTSCRHYYLNQKICGKMFYPSYKKSTLNHIRNILGQGVSEWDLNQYLKKNGNSSLNKPE